MIYIYRNDRRKKKKIRRRTKTTLHEFIGESTVTTITRLLNKNRGRGVKGGGLQDREKKVDES